jgi:uncharacterized integral membrane protein
MADIPEAAGQGKTPDRRRDTRMVLMGIAAVLLVWFALANLQEVEIHFWVFSAHISLVVVVVLSAVLGALIALLVSSRRRKRASQKSEGP